MVQETDAVVKTEVSHWRGIHQQELELVGDLGLVDSS